MGKIRSEMGHPQPFNLKFIAVGNEQWGKEYVDRLQPFVEAIRKAYPNINIIGGSGPGSEGDQFDYLWPQMKKLKVDLVTNISIVPKTGFFLKEHDTIRMIEKAQKFLQVNMLVTEQGKNGTISTLHCSKQPS
jgi:alpha-L-arabinofuranosidase